MSEPEPLLVPARMVNEFVYCPRLAHLEWVQGEWRESADTVEGSRQHRRVDRPTGRVPSPPTKTGEAGADGAGDGVDGADDATGDGDVDGDGDRFAPAERERWRARSVWLSSPRLGLGARLDLLEADDGVVRPVESKRGSGPEGGGAWDADRAQVGVQCLILRDLGYVVRDGVVYYRASKRRVAVTLDADLERETLAVAQATRALARAEQPPPPLVDSPKCPRCSLVSICLPDETHLLLRSSADAGPDGGRADDEPPEAEPDVRRLLPARGDRLPLYVQSPGARVGKRGDELEVTETDGRRTRVRLLDTSQVCLFGNAQVTTQAIRELLQRGLPIAWLSSGGWFYGLATPLGGRQGALRHAQHLLTADPVRSLAVARGLIARKVRNSRTILRRNHRGAPDAALVELQRLARDAARAPTKETLLGIEGLAARRYFQEFACLLTDGAGQAFQFEGRNRRPPTDPVNALLSLAYAMLTKDWTTALFSVGLDPHVGVLHSTTHGKPALALDLMEEFRPLVAESVVVQAVNNGEIGPRHFVRRGNACNLNPAGRKKFLLAYERRKDHLVTHPIFGYKLAYRQLLEVQSRLFGRLATGELPAYAGFETR